MRIQEHMIEFSPLSIKGRKALSRLISNMKQLDVSTEEISKLQDENCFLDNYYVEPFTRVNKGNWINDNVSEDDTDVYNIDVLEKTRDNFEKELSYNLVKLFWVNGTAGCGKSTYVHKLGQIYKESISMSFYDFEDIKKRCIIKCFDSTSHKSFMIGNDSLWANSNRFKFLILLISNLIDNLFINKLDQPHFCNKLKAITEEYDKYQDSEDDFEYVIKFFGILRMVVYEETYHQGIENLAGFFKEVIDTFAEKNSDKNGIKEPSIIILMDILLHVLLYKGNIEKKSQVCVFDNIEYIASWEYGTDRVLITDSTIESILNSIHSAISTCVQKTIRANYDFVPKIVVVTRKATVAFNGNLEGNNYQSLEITNWFCAKEIYAKRIDLVSKYVMDDERAAYDVFTLIMNDCTMSKWSFVPFFSKLFNYNIRRMARILLYILSINSTSSEKEELNKFVELWKKNNEKGSAGNHIKHFFRMYIIRLVLDSFNGYPRELGSNQNPAFLNKLMIEQGDIDTYEKLTIPSNGEDLFKASAKKYYENEKDTEIARRKQDEYLLKIEEKIRKVETSYTRKILTILHRAEIDGIYNGNNRSVIGLKYFNIEDLIKNLLLDGNTKDAKSITPETITVISDILFLMNEVTDSTGWVPLTSIKWKNTEEKYTASAINKVLNNALENIRSHCDPDFSYGIRVTYAGQILLMLLPEFEFFATRFCPLEPKLISDRCLSKDKNDFVCINIINRVLYYSLRCVYTVIKRAEKEYSSVGANASIDYKRMHASKTIYLEAKGYPRVIHPTRIFSRQINYLNIFKEYVGSLAPDKARFKDEKEKEELLQALDKVIDEYVDWEKYFMATYPKFFQWRDNF